MAFMHKVWVDFYRHGDEPFLVVTTPGDAKILDGAVITFLISGEPAVSHTIPVGRILHMETREVED